MSEMWKIIPNVAQSKTTNARVISVKVSFPLYWIANFNNGQGQCHVSRPVWWLRCINCISWHKGGAKWTTKQNI